MGSIVEWLLGIPLERLATADGASVAISADYDNYQIALLVVALAALVVLVVHCYRREGTTAAGAKVVLASLRLAVILTVMLIVLRPVLKLRFVNILLSKVIVLVDDSRSMSLTDRYEDPQDRSAMQQTLGLSEGQLAGLTRSELLQRKLSASDGPIAKLLADHPVEIMSFSTARGRQGTYARTLATIPPLAPGPAPASAPAELSAAVGQLRSDGSETDLPRAVRDAIEHVQGQQVAAIVVVSDGQQTTPGASARIGAAVDYARLRGGGAVPIYTVVVGDPAPPRNVAVTSLQAPREVRLKETPELTVVLAHRNMANRQITVRLRRRKADATDWTETPVRQTVTLKGPEGPADAAATVRQDVVLQIEPDQLGEFVYRAVADPVPEEVNVDDNYAEAPVRVSEAKLRILIVSGQAGWEFQYLRNYLLQSPEAYLVSIWQQNADKDVTQAATNARLRLAQLPRTLEQILGVPGQDDKPGYDVVILCDPQPTVGGFDAEFATLLKTFVGTHGKGLCYVTGTKYTQQVLIGDPAYKPLRDVLPVTIAPNTVDLAERLGTRQPKAWPTLLTSYGRDHPLTRLGGSTEESAEIWNILPGVYWSQAVDRVKPGARVLAEHSNLRRQVLRGLRNQREPLIAVQPVGKGRVLYLGSDETWRWRFIREGYYHRRFWDNVVRYLASPEARQVVITTGGDRFDIASRIVIRVQAFDDKYQPLRSETFDVTIERAENGKPETITLSAVKNRPGLYEGIFEPARVGTYALSALAGDPKAADKVAGKRITVTLPQAELRRPEADYDSLRRLAVENGRFLRLWETASLTDDPVAGIPAGKLRVVREQPMDLWDTPLTLMILVLLLTAEWIIRKKFNMT